MTSPFRTWNGVDSHEVHPGVRLTAIGGEQVLLCRVTYDPGKQVKLHSHEACEQVMAIIAGSVDMTIEGETKTLVAGDVVVVNRGLEHELFSRDGVTFFEALGPVPLDHVPDRERDLVLGQRCGARRTMTTVVLIGTLDTKGAECAFLRDRLRDGGVDVVVVDCGIGEHDHDFATVGADEVARAGGADLAALRAKRDRGSAVSAMAEGARATVLALHATKQCDGVLAAGGSGNTSIATAAMRALPIGLPKLMVSTVAAGDVSGYVGAVDITMMASVVDIAGINSISSRILANAAAAMVGMVTAPAPPAPADDRPLVAASMFGVTTPCVTRAREQLERDGYEVLVFHATGTGGRALEGLAAAGHLAGVLDVTTTELADEVVGGTLTAGPDRLEAAGRAGIPQAVSLGAVDMVNFGAMASVPERFKERNLYAHNDSVTLMRTTPDECAEIGRRIAAKLSAATGPTALFVPLRGVSMIATEGGPFHDAAADEALLGAVRDGLDTEVVELFEMDCDVNDEAFADAMAGWLAGQIEAAR